MKTYTAKLLSKKEIAKDTFEFEFTKPEDFDYFAGQYTVIKVSKMPENDERGDCRTMSIDSAPCETTLKFAMRLGISCFKNAFHDMLPGDEVTVTTPKGRFLIDPSVSRPAVFLIGGIGITPVRSMILQALHDKVNRGLYLFYSNRRPEDAPYLVNFSELKAENYHFIPTMTNMDESKTTWNGETGYISNEMIQKYVSNIHDADFFIVGPTGFCDAMSKILRDMEVQDSYIHLDKFTGYA